MADKSKLHRSVPARVHVIGSLEIRDIAESDSASPVAEFSRSVASRVCVGGRLGFRSIIRRKATTRASLHFKLASRLVSRLRRRAIQVQLALGTVAVAIQAQERQQRFAF